MMAVEVRPARVEVALEAEERAELEAAGAEWPGLAEVAAAAQADPAAGVCRRHPTG
jgi:hypothetical protein